MSKEALLQIADLARENPNINILSDEIYELILKKEFKHYNLSTLASDLKERLFSRAQRCNQSIFNITKSKYK
jgi:aspartate aminotransferase